MEAPPDTEPSVPTVLGGIIQPSLSARAAHKSICSMLVASVVVGRAAFSRPA